METSQSNRVGNAAPVLIATLTGVSWAFLLFGAGMGMSIDAMSTLTFPPPAHSPSTPGEWSSGHTARIAFMWGVMMIAMMTPGLSVHLLAGKAWRCHVIPAAGLVGFTRTARFCAGYFSPWMVYSLAATALQFVLEAAGLLDGMTMWSRSGTMTSAILAAAGIFQMSDLKRRSLERCKVHWPVTSPFATGMGLGSCCVIASGPLMLLLFVGGVMNLYWILTLTAIATIEKTLPNPRLFSVTIGVICIVGATGIAMT